MRAEAARDNALAELFAGSRCADLGCELRTTYSVLRLAWVVQHEQDSEARLVIDDLVRVNHRDLRPMVREWCDSIHTWLEQGTEPEGQTDDDERQRLIDKFTWR